MKCNLQREKSLYALAVDTNKQYRRMIVTRLFMAVALVLNDIRGYGTVRIVRVLRGLAEIINGYAIFSAEMNKDMAAELKERNIVLPDEFMFEESKEE